MCGICRMPFDGCHPEGKFPGDDSPVVWGVCTHAFHLQCINRRAMGVWQWGWPVLAEQTSRAKWQPAACAAAGTASRAAHPPPSLAALPCVLSRRWLSSQAEQRCPFCRGGWEFKQAVVGGEDDSDA